MFLLLTHPLGAQLEVGDVPAPLINYPISVQTLNVTTLQASLTPGIPPLDLSVLPLEPLILVQQAPYELGECVPHDIRLAALCEELALHVPEDLRTRGPGRVLQWVLLGAIVLEGDILFFVSEGRVQQAHVLRGRPDHLRFLKWGPLILLLRHFLIIYK